MNRAILVVTVVVLGGCGSYDVCGPSTCNGCCTSDGECVTGTFGSACGINGLWCQACAPQQICRVGICGDDLPAADSGAPDAGGEADAGVLYVTLRYERAEQTATSCPMEWARKTCSTIHTMSPDTFSAVRVQYPECNVTQTDESGYLIDCTGHCAEEARKCEVAATKYADYTLISCTVPAHCGSGACNWTP